MKKSVLYTSIIVICFLLGFLATSIPTNTVFKEETDDTSKVVDTNRKVYVNNVDISNLSYDDAVLKVSNIVDLDNEILTIIIGDEKFEASFSELTFNYEYSNAIKKAQSKNTEEIVSVQTNILFEDDRIYEIVDSLKLICDVPLEKDEIEFNDGNFVVVKESKGYILDREKSFNKIVEALNNGETTIVLELDEVTNKDILGDINSYMTEIGTATTKYTGSVDGRITNLKVASNSLNGTFVYPDEIFSTNTNFSPYTSEKGYQNGLIIVGGEFVDGIGGGVCQVSSTLYKALIYAELDIVERYNHSLKVGYMDYGYDAVLASTYKDLKFRNDTTRPVYIHSHVGDGEVIVTLYGEEVHDPNRNLKFSNQLVRSIEPKEPVIVENPDMYIGEELVKIKPLYGHEYNVYKHIYDGDTLIETVHVNRSVYSSRAEERHVGIREPENVVEITEELPEESNVESLEDENLENENLEDDINTMDNHFNDEGLVANNEEIQEVITENNSNDVIGESISENNTNNVLDEVDISEEVIFEVNTSNEE